MDSSNKKIWEGQENKNGKDIVYLWIYIMQPKPNCKQRKGKHAKEGIARNGIEDEYLFSHIDIETNYSAKPTT